MSQPSGKRVLVFFDFDKAVINFHFNGSFRAIASKHRICFVAPAINKRFNIDTRTSFAGHEYRVLAVDTARAEFWRWLSLLDQLALRPGKRWRKLRRMRRLQMSPIARVFWSIAALPGLRQIAGWMVRGKLARGKFEALERLLDEEAPDFVIYPSAFNGAYGNDLVLACRGRNIPTAFIMNSWDNPSTKNALADHPDWLLVWGQQTADHAVRFMGIPPERVVVFGAPQFEIYSAPSPIDREQLKRSLGLDPARPVLLFGGSSLFSGEGERLEIIDRWCAAQPDPKPQVLFRPYPFPTGHPNSELVNRPWKNIVVQQFSKKRKDPNMVYNLASNRLAALQACDGVISALSTILLEGMALGKPVICVYPTHLTKEKFAPRNAPLDHFSDILTNPDVVVIDRDDKLPDAMVKVLRWANDGNQSARLRKAVEHVVANFSEPYSERLLKFVDRALVRERAST